MLKQHYLFFRDDDVRRLDPSFLRFFNLFWEKKIPVVYGVIPSKAEKNLIRFLRDRKKKSPPFLDIAQHGWRHQNYGSETDGPKFEFGPSRAYGQQKKDIVEGWLTLYRAFGSGFSPAFIPPYHGYDFVTLQAVNELGERKNLHVFSAGKKTFSKEKNFLDIPASLSFAPPRRGKENYLPHFLKELRQKLSQQAVTGILLHHAAYDQADLKILGRFLALLKKQGRASPILFSSLIKKPMRTKFDLTIEVTNRCNLKCRMCNIWAERPKRDLGLKDIQGIVEKLSRRFALGSVSLTGGEPFLNPEFEKIFRFLAAAKTKKQIDSIGIYTNGFAATEILNFLKNNRPFLDGCELGISLDGLASRHNMLRGNSRAFAQTASLLRQIKTDFPKVNVVAKCTLNPVNYKDLAPIYRFCLKNRVSLLPKFAESNVKFYYHRCKIKNHFRFDFAETERTTLAAILKTLYRKEVKTKKHVIDPMILRILLKFVTAKKECLETCYTPLYSLFITARGAFHPCLYLPATAHLKDPRWINKMMNNRHLDIIEQGLGQKCPSCFAYHGFLKTFNLEDFYARPA